MSVMGPSAPPELLCADRCRDGATPSGPTAAGPTAIAATTPTLVHSYLFVYV